MGVISLFCLLRNMMPIINRLKMSEGVRTMVEISLKKKYTSRAPICKNIKVRKK